MARIERVSTTQPVPIERAQLVDPGAFRFGDFSAQELKVIGGTLEELAKRHKASQDSLSVNAASESRDLASLQMKQFMLDNPDPDTWSDGMGKILAGQQKIYLKQKFSAEAKANEDIEQKAFEDEINAKIQIAATTQTIQNDITVSGKNLINKIANDDGSTSAAADIDKHLKLYQEALERRDTKEVAAIQMEETLKEAQKLQIDNLISDVHSAIESASDPRIGGNFEDAKELAKNPLIPEVKQTSLRNTIKTAETARKLQLKEERQLLVDTTTSDTIREYFSDDLTVATLNERHEKGLIKDSEFKFMMTGLSKETPDNSDPFAAGRIRRAYADFEMGAIIRTDADKIVLENYAELDGPDRSTVVADLEDIATNIIGAAKANAYSEGKRLMSLQFVGIESQDEFERLILGKPGLTDEDKKRLNRLWDAELANRDLYEKAIKARFAEMRKEGISSGKQYEAESLDILLQYRKRNTLKLEELEAAVSKEQKKIIGKGFGERPSGEKKGQGFLGVLNLKGGGIATEYSVGVKLEANDGKETDIPSLVPTLTKAEIDLMVNDIIPNRKPVPPKILQKAVDHANKRVRVGKSPFADTEKQIIKPVSEMTTAEKQRELERIRELKRLAR